MLISVAGSLRTPSHTHLENLINSSFSGGRVDPYLFPARGRKRRRHGGASDWPNHVDPYLFPARGRKQKLIGEWLVPGLYQKLIPTFSPQGDGNLNPAGFARGQSAGLIPTFSPQGDGNRNEHLAGATNARPGPGLIPTFSPQGDGNRRSRRMFVCVSGR